METGPVQRQIRAEQVVGQEVVGQPGEESARGVRRAEDVQDVSGLEDQFGHRLGGAFLGGGDVPVHEHSPRSVDPASQAHLPRARMARNTRPKILEGRTWSHQVLTSRLPRAIAPVASPWGHSVPRVRHSRWILQLSRRRRPLTLGGLISAALSVALLASLVVVVAPASPAAAADAGCASFGSSFATEEIPENSSNLRIGCARDAGELRSLANGDSDLVLAVDFHPTQRPDQLRGLLTKAAEATEADMARGLSLSRALELRAQRYGVDFFDQPNEVDFDGSVHVVGTSLVFVVPAGDIGTAGFWTGFWTKLVAGVIGIAVGVVTGSVCLLAFSVAAPAAGPVCVRGRARRLTGRQRLVRLGLTDLLDCGGHRCRQASDALHVIEQFNALEADPTPSDHVRGSPDDGPRPVLGAGAGLDR